MAGISSAFKVLELDHGADERLELLGLGVRQRHAVRECPDRAVFVVGWRRVESVTVGGVLPVSAAGRQRPIDMRKPSWRGCEEADRDRRMVEVQVFQHICGI